MKDSQICDVSENVVKMTNDFFGDRNYAFESESLGHRSMVGDTRLGEDGGEKGEEFYRIEEGDGWKKDGGEGEEWNGQLRRSNLTIEAEDLR
jgi:hypothetical protein